MTDTSLVERVDVAIVGGGPAGAATAVGLARRGYSVAIFERHPTPTWRACGVFTTPLVRDRLSRLGFDSNLVEDLHRPISAMELQATGGAACRLEYGGDYACGFDRVRLDEALLDHAAIAGADVRRGAVVRDVSVGDGAAVVTWSRLDSDGEPTCTAARIVVGADGGGSRVARAAAVHVTTNWLGRSAITFHVSDPAAAAQGEAATARFVLGRGWYVGLAPVPGARVNVGIVVPAARLHDGVQTVIDGTWRGTAERTDEPQVAGRLEHHTKAAAGDNWLLVGDAIGFIDPLTGEGLHRALVTADLASDAISRRLAGDRAALAVYDRRVRSRFRSKNVFSLVLQAFIANSQVLGYALRRLDSRADLRAELIDVLTDRTRASSALDPRFMARLLAP